MDKLIKCWKCQAQGDSDIDVTNDEEHATKAYPLEGEAIEGYFITKEQLVWALEQTAFDDSEYCVQQVLKDLGVK